MRLVFPFSLALPLSLSRSALKETWLGIVLTHNALTFALKASTGSGFTFSSVYNYDGMLYYGEETFVHCAEEQKRYDECSSLMICVTSGTTHYDFLKTAFPSDYYKLNESYEEITNMLFDGTCIGAHELNERDCVVPYSTEAPCTLELCLKQVRAMWPRTKNHMFLRTQD